MHRGWAWLLLFGLLLLLVVLVGGGPLAGVDTQGEPEAKEPTANGSRTTTATDTGERTLTTEEATPETVTVTFLDANGTELGAIAGPIADTESERHTGLSDTERLGPNEGMVFGYEETASRTFVMRDMAFPIDIIFVDGNGEITAIYEAAADDERLFTAQARWVIEVNRGYSAGHGITEGDFVRGLPR